MRYIVVVEFPKKVENERIGQMVTRGNGLEVKSIISEQQLFPKLLNVKKQLAW